MDFSFFTNRTRLFNRETVDGKEQIKRVKRKTSANESLFLRIQKYESSTDPEISRYARAFLEHPVSQLYVHNRWEEMGWIFYLLIMTCHFIYSMTFSMYAIQVYRNLCPMSIEENYYSSEDVTIHSVTSMMYHFNEPVICQLNAANSTSGTFLKSFPFTTRANLAITAWICLIIFTILMFIRELTELYDRKKQNFYELDTWIHLFLMAMFVICSFHQNPFTETVTVKKYQHHAATWGVFATWIQMLLYMERTPRFGAYIHMLRKVSKTILNLFWAYLSLIAAFAFSFYLLFPSHHAFNNDIPTVFVKVSLVAIYSRVNLILFEK